MNTKKPYSLAIALSLISFFLSKDVLSQDSSGVYWQRFIGGSGNEIMPLNCGSLFLSSLINFPDHYCTVIKKPDIRPTPDGGSILVATTYSNDGDIAGLRSFADTSTNGSDVLVMKMDADGKVQWKKCYGGTGYDFGGAILPVSNGYVIAGETNSADGGFNCPPNVNPVLFLMLIDFQGNVQWQKTYGSFPTLGGYTMDVNDISVEAIEKTPSGNYGILLNKETFINNLKNDLPYIYSFYYFETDPNGQAIMANVFGGTNDCVATGMKINNDGSIIVSGYTACTGGSILTSPILSGLYSGFVIKFKNIASGSYSVQWQKNFWYMDNASCTKITSMAVTNSGNIFIGGYSYSGSTNFDDPFNTTGWFAKLDSDGNVLFANVKPGSPAVFSIDTASNGGCLLGILSTCATMGLGLDRIDSAGNNLWSRCYGYGASANIELKARYVNEFQQFIIGVSNATNINIPNHNSFYSPHAKVFCSDDIWLIKSGAVNVIDGTAFVDINKNGTRDSFEPLAKNIWVQSSKNGIFLKSEYVTDGHFFSTVDTGTFVSSLGFPHPGEFSFLPDTVSFNSFSNTHNISFALEPINSTYDGSISLGFLSIPRPGSIFKYILTAQNDGTNALSNLQMILVKDKRLNLSSASRLPTKVTGDTLIWALSNLDILDQNKVYVDFIQSPQVTLGYQDTLNFFCKLTHDLTDPTPLDDQLTIHQLIRDPADPNEKTETHEGGLYQSEYANGENLNYTINFQNIGNDTAFNVRVTDTLSTKLDPASLEIVATSNNCVVTRKSSNIIDFNFPGINLLPKSTNDSLSKGYICFKAKPIANLKVGDSIMNNASIYFDFNPPVKTNWAITTIIEDNKTHITNDSTNINSGLFNLFPNPATNYFSIKYIGTNSDEFNVLICDNNGRYLLNTASVFKTGSTITYPVLLAQGIYFVTISNGKSKIIKKLMIF